MSDELLRLSTWRALEALPPDFPLGVHPDDEMLRFLAAAPHLRRGRAGLLYLRSGQEAADALARTLAACERPLADLPQSAALLEFACGFGRVTRHLARRVGRARLFSCDVVPAAVDHVAAAFGVRSFLSNADPDAIAWPRQFDVIFVASLFSHLSRHRFEAWLRRLRDGLTSDGLLVISTHGRGLPIAPAADGGDFAFVPASESSQFAPDEYGSTFVAPELVARLARAAGFVDVRWRERGLWSLQDLFVASPVRPLPAQFPAAPLLDGAIDAIEVDRTHAYWLRGWVSSRSEDGPAARAVFHVDGRPVTAATLHDPEERVDGAGVRRLLREWHLLGVVPSGVQGRHTVALMAHPSDGTASCVDVRTIEPGAAAPRFVDDDLPRAE